MLLALDTATGAIGAAVLQGDRVLAEVTHQDSRRHGELLAPSIEAALAQAGATVADLSVVAVGVGPGPFTGLRVGVVSALVLGQLRGIPVHGICSHDAIAEQAVAEHIVEGDFLVATDARRKEVYWAQYAVRQGRPHRTGGPGVAKAADLPAAVRELPAVGRGPMLYDVLRAARPQDSSPLDVRPGYLGLVAQRALAGDERDGILLAAEPLYLRRPDAAPIAAPAKAVP